jgi:uncharacterized sulfatase
MWRCQKENQISNLGKGFMKRIILEIILLLVLLGCADKKENAVSQENKASKNVLFIVVDDLNKALGTYGHPILKTPNVDRLAQMGIQFNNAHCNYAVCNPSRSSLLTGLRPETTGILNNTTPFQSRLGDRVSLPALFKKNGFHTMGLGKIFHRAEKKHNDLDAWDEMYGFKATDIGKTGEKRNLTNDLMRWCYWQATEGDDEDQPDGQVAKKAIEFINAKREKPFFLAVGMAKPHDPYVAPKKYFEMYPLEDMELHQVPENWEIPNQNSFPRPTRVFPDGTETFSNFSEQDKREFLRAYYACITFMDAQLGKILDALEASGQMENTTIVFFGDHGYHLGEQDWWNKFTLYEKGTGAPFIMAGPPIAKKGMKTESMIEFIDIYPTLADIFQLKNTPNYLEGKSFARVLDNPGQPFRSEVRAVMTRDAILGKSVKNEEWRYIEWEGGEQGVELYNQQRDPLEYNNLAGSLKYAPVINDMKKLLYDE